jgi:hypothetical protein
MQTCSRAAADSKDSTTSHDLQLQQILLPPLLSLASWRDGDQLVADPAFSCEPEVPLSELPSPSRRFPLLNRPKRCDLMISANNVAKKAVLPTRTRSRTFPVCPATNCRLISLSWDENFFADDDQIETGAKIKPSTQRYGSNEVVSQTYRNGFPKRRPIVARAKLPVDYHANNAEKMFRFNDDDGDVVGYRRHWKELVKDKRRLGEDDWKRENTGLFMDHVSALLTPSKSPKNNFKVPSE